MLGTPVDHEGTGNTLLSHMTKRGPEGVSWMPQWWQESELQTRCPPPHQAWEEPTWKKTKSSPIFCLYIFIFLAMEWGISQGKIWVKVHSPGFQYITFLQDLWLFSPWLEQMLLDYQALFTFFSYLSSIILIQLASLFRGSAFAIWLPCVHTTFPSTSLYLCVSFVLSYLFFCQNGYLCNSSPFVSWSVQRGSPKQLCTLGASICDLYLCLEEKTSFSIFLILTSQPVYSFQLANVLLQFWVCSSLEAYFREILYNAENIFALSPRTLFCGIFFLKTEQRAVANASSLALVVSF